MVAKYMQNAKIKKLAEMDNKTSLSTNGKYLREKSRING